MEHVRAGLIKAIESLCQMLMSAVYSWGRAGNPPTPNSSMSPPPTTPPDSAAQQIGAAAIWRRAIRYCRPPPLFLFLHLTLFYRSLLRQYYKAKQQNPVQVQLSRPQYNLYMSQSKTKKKRKGRKAEQLPINARPQQSRRLRNQWNSRLSGRLILLPRLPANRNLKWYTKRECWRQQSQYAGRTNNK